MMLGVWAALSAALAIGAVAFGAHGVANPEAGEWLRIGGLYQLIHAVAVITVMQTARRPATLMLVGAAIFAFSLYAIGLGAPRWIGTAAPMGGMVLIGSWLWVALTFFTRSRD